MSDNMPSRKTMTLPPELWLIIIRYISPDPFVYIQLSKVSKMSYSILTSDSMWRYLDPYGWQTDLYVKFIQFMTKRNGYEIRKLRLLWMGANLRLSKLPASLTEELSVCVHDLDNLYARLGFNLYRPKRFTEGVPVGRDLMQLRWCIENFPQSPESTPPNFKNNKKFALDTIKFYPTLLLHLHSSVRNDKDVVLAALWDAGRKLVAEVLRACDTKFLGDLEVILAAVRELLDMAPEDIRNDHELLRTASLSNKEALRTPKLKVTRSLVKTTLLTTRWLEYVREIWLDEEMVRLAVSKYPENLRIMPFHWRDSQEIIMSAGEKCGHCLQWASDRLKDDEETVLKVVTINPFALVFASDRLRDKYEVVSAAISKDGSSLQYASGRLRSYPIIIKQAMQYYSRRWPLAWSQVRGEKRLELEHKYARYRRSNFMFRSVQREVRPREVRPREARPREVRPREARPREVRPREARPREVRPREVRPRPIRH